MKILVENRSDGRKFLLCDENPNGESFVLGRFKALTDAGVALRYLSGLPMTDEEKSHAVNVIRNYDDFCSKKSKAS